MIASLSTSTDLDFVMQTGRVLCDVETEPSFSRSVVNINFTEQPLALSSKPQRRSSIRRLVEMRCRRVFTAIPWLRRLIACLSAGSPGFDPRSADVRFVVDRVTLI